MTIHDLRVSGDPINQGFLQQRKKPAAVEIPAGVKAELSPDGRLLALRSSRGVALVEVSSGKELGKLEGHVAPIWYATFSPDSETLATASRAGVIKLWDVSNYGK